MEREVLEKILAQVLGVDTSEIHTDTTFIKDLGADSLDIFQIVACLQEEFNVEFDPAGVEKLETVGDAVVFIRETLAKQR